MKIMSENRNEIHQNNIYYIDFKHNEYLTPNLK